MDHRAPHVVFAIGSLALVLATATLGSPQPTGADTRSTGRSPEERQRINQRFVEQVTARIAGREREPAGRVFRNIRFPLFTDIPAADLIDIMQGGYSRALGVTCDHCHVEADFASDEKRPKRAAREMADMHRAINQQLARMRDLASEPEDRFINCGTCHRGSLRPQRRSP